MSISFALVGAGAMGGAMLRRWLSSSAIRHDMSAVLEPQLDDDLAAACQAHGVAVNPALDTVRPDLLVLAVKPQIAAEVLPQLGTIAHDCATISVMAGVSVESLSRHLGGAQRLVRAMPNLPAQFGEGVTGVFASSAASATDRASVDLLLGEIGDVVWVDEESHVDAVTAISGSGPAYFFLLAEAMTEAGRALGLSQDAATQLARHTLSGAGAVVREDERHVCTLREAVTSPGGTTAAALGVFDGEGRPLRTLTHAATQAAFLRARELSS